MQIKFLWSNRTKSELEVKIPKGVVPLTMPAHGLSSLRPPQIPPSALHQTPDGSWLCWRTGADSLQGYCQPAWMLGQSVCGLTWDEAKQNTAISRCLSMLKENGEPYYKETDWMRDYNARLRYAEKFHFNGHHNAQEAINCYQEFLRDFGQEEI